MFAFYRTIVLASPSHLVYWTLSQDTVPCYNDRIILYMVVLSETNDTGEQITALQIGPQGVWWLECQKYNSGSAMQKAKS